MQTISFEAFDTLGHGGKPYSLQYIMYYLKAKGDGEMGNLQDHRVHMHSFNALIDRLQRKSNFFTFYFNK